MQRQSYDYLIDVHASRVTRVGKLGTITERMPLYKPLPKKFNPLSVNRSQISNGVYQSYNHLPPTLPILHHGGRLTQENSQEYEQILHQMDVSKENKFISLQEGEDNHDNSFYNPNAH